MRYALRNQNKIAEQLGRKALAEIKEALAEFFHVYEDEAIDYIYKEKGRDWLRAGDFLFVVYDSKWDILKLAYYGRAEGD